MSFLLQELPDRTTLNRYAERFANLDVDATTAYLRVLAAGSKLLGELDGMLAEHGLTHGRWLTLVVLHRSGGRLLPSQLAEKQGVTRATMTGLLTGLCRDGLIRRVGSDDDRRRAAAQLTPKGRRRVERLLPLVYDHINQQMAVLASAQHRSLGRLVGKLIPKNEEELVA
ncbi:MAG: MarR family transcriptional regulator [Planctomycetota bacterium]